jgi:D-alanyl-D-alanine dipeptidase
MNLKVPHPHPAKALSFLFPALVASADASPEHLANVRSLDRPPLEEIRYATCYNFTGERLYPFPAAFVHVDLVPALQAIQNELAAEGLGLKIYDGYRPLSVQQKMWDLIHDEHFVSNPAADYPGGSEEQRQNRDKLQAIMTRHGFETFPHEWWHFDWKGWQDYAPLDISFEKLAHR